MSAVTAQEAQAHPAADPVWGIEQNGINSIPDTERHGSPFELFWIWFAANISVLAIVYGAIVVSFGLNLWQSILAAFVGTWLSFLLVGFVSLAGKRSGAPTLVLSRASFGIFGNVFPNLASYLSLVGWETVLVALSTLAVEALFKRLSLPTGTGLTAVTFILIALLVIAVGLLGHATIVRIQTWFTWAFTVLTVIFVILEIPKINGAQLTALHSGSWLNGFIPATSIIMAALGLGWVNSAADYSRYLPRRASSRSVVGWTTFGGSIAPFLLIVFGVLLFAKNQSLASSSNPIGDIAAPLPTWFLVPYLVVAVGGLVAGAVLDIYSSGLNLLTLGLRVERYKSVALDGAIMIAGNIYILFVAKNFVGPFEAFLSVLGVLLTAWVAVFLVDLVMFRRQGYREADLYTTGPGAYHYWHGVNPRALFAWFAAVIVGLGLITSTVSWLTWLGWWARGPFANSSLGILVAFVIGAALYWALNLIDLPKNRALASQSSGSAHPAE
ncbi:MAG: purine-cytosine permease family protein [Chloroflexota bacterium]|nr:MAG: allantoin permease [Chloroflexota bacterium]